MGSERSSFLPVPERSATLITRTTAQPRHGPTLGHKNVLPTPAQVGKAQQMVSGTSTSTAAEHQPSQPNL